MRRLVLLVPVLALLGGCSEDMYYQTRYIPTDIESTYSLSAQVGWSGDREVYELPAAPPDLDGTHRPRADCAYPYQKFKSDPIVGYADEHPRSSTDIGLTNPGGYDDRVRPDGPRVGMQAPPVYATDGRPPYHSQVPETSDYKQAGLSDWRPHSVTSSHEVEPQSVGGWNARANPYCCGDGAAPTVDAYGRPLGASK